MKTLDTVSLSIPTTAKVAVIGDGSSGKDALGHLLARITVPSNGTVRIDGKDWYQIPESVFGARTAYLGPETYLFPLSVRENLLFGLKHRPVKPAPYDDAGQAG